MSEHDEPEPAETEDDVEAHGLKEAAITGLSAAALIAGGRRDRRHHTGSCRGHVEAGRAQDRRGAQGCGDPQGRDVEGRGCAEGLGGPDAQARVVGGSDLEARDRSDAEARLARPDAEAGRPGRDLSR